MSEAGLWADVQRGMQTRWHCQRHEDKYSTGIPDVSYGIDKRADGWVELKYLPDLPRLTGRPWDFKYDHFTSDQRNWLEMRSRHGTGRVFVMCRFGDAGTCIWNWGRLRQRLGVEPLEKILDAANGQWWHHPIDFADLANVLANNRIIPPRFKL